MVVIPETLRHMKGFGVGLWHQGLWLRGSSAKELLCRRRGTERRELSASVLGLGLRVLCRRLKNYGV